MVIEKYGIRLVQLEHRDIEMVRAWRNDPKISQYMEFRDYITPEMQEMWFAKIDNNNNCFFVIEYEGKQIGLVNVKDIDYEKKKGEAGIFIYDDLYLNGTLSFRTILALTDFCFEDLSLDYLVAHIMRDNKRAVDFNRLLGYKLTEGQENTENRLYMLTKDDYKKATENIKRLIK